ncbi:MAG TPA: MFS transporter [Candidatus Limnocylindrales bacterium]
MARSVWSVILGTLTLRFSTGLTGAMLVYYLADLPKHGGEPVSSITVAIFTASFFAAELVLSPLFGPLADRYGYHRIMQLGPAFGAVAVILTGITTNLWLLGGTRWLEGASTAASVPSILGFIAIATMGDEGLRGKAVARFEAATLAGLGAGIVAAGPLWTLLHREAFFVNALIYGVSWAIYRFGVADPRADHGGHQHEQRTSLARYLEILSGAHVWLLAPTWIAVNAAIGLWTSQSIFQLVKAPDPRYADQRLMAGVSPLLVSAGLAVGMLVFLAGLVYWGNRFKKLRRTTIIFYGLGGGAALVAAAVAINHGAGMPAIVTAILMVPVVGGLFVLAGATPAALGLLADMSEPYPRDRGAIMGLYSVFLALGQITGSIAGGVAADVSGIDGLLVATLVMLAIAVLPLWRLRTVEHQLNMLTLPPPEPAAAPDW